jgi:tRNA-specific 2-thiouridylase
MIGADFLATGHYARLDTQKDKTIHLLQAVDKTKDQSYVLGVLSQKELKHTLFPLGGYTKPEIRELARKYRLPVSTTKDSQDLCFLAGTDYRSFIQRQSNGTQKRGIIKNTKGEILGKHDGLAMYTIGQRKGLGLSSPEPMYVIDKNTASNTLIIGNSKQLGRDELTASQVNWISGNPPSKPFRANVKIRYRSLLVTGKMTPLNNDKFHVQFSRPLRDITPGQAAVIYKGEEVIASGIIDNPHPFFDN